MIRRAGALALPLWLLLSPPATAQEPPPTLEEAEELARAGRVEDARRMLLGWWERTRAGASRRDVQHALWLRGRLTVDPVQAVIDFRRLTVEFPGGPYSDQALFRLAQGAFAAGDSAAAAGEVSRLIREYPGSSYAREAEAWLAGAGSPPEQAEGARGPAAPVTPPATRAPARVESESSAPAERARPSVGSFAVQLGAFADARRAEALMARASRAGFEARLARVPGSDLVRVRVGAFDVQADADAILKRLQELGFTAALVKDAHLEEGVVR